MSSPTLRACVLALLALGQTLIADAPLPPNILEPKTPAEAWNIIRLATANVDRLLAEDRSDELANQIALCSPALRTLAKAKGSTDVQAVVDRASGWVVATASAGIEKNGVRATNTMTTLRALLEELAGYFDPATVKAEIFICPTHPEITSEEPKLPCVKCGRELIQRRIPYSFVYVPPGNPTLRLTAAADAPIQAGRKTTVKVQLRKPDGSPVQHSDLMIVHTRPIHLLLADPSLTDFHHEQPEPTATPGEYVFTYTPKKSAPYRLWADLVPTATGQQELPTVELGSAGKTEPILDEGPVLTATTGGLNFALAVGGNVQPYQRRACGLTLTVTDSTGRPMTQLEPLLGAFAQLIGIYEDYETVLHLHPVGTELSTTETRGGPSIRFTFYPPRAGLIRLFAMVRVNGEKLVVPLTMRVEP